MSVLTFNTDMKDEMHTRINAKAAYFFSVFVLHTKQGQGRLTRKQTVSKSGAQTSPALNMT